MSVENGRSSVNPHEVFKGIAVLRPPLVNLDDNGYYRLDGWSTPVGVDAREIGIISDSENYRDYLNKASCMYHYKVTEAITEGGLPRSLAIKHLYSWEGNRASGRIISTIRETGEADYQLEGVKDSEVAYLLQTFVSQFVNIAYSESGNQATIPDITGERGRGYGPRELKLPFKLVRTSFPVTEKSYQEAFIEWARATAARFGRQLRAENNFSSNGLLEKVSLLGGGIPDYWLDDMGRYGSHNVDLPEQAICLQWIVGKFMSDVEEKLSCFT